MTGRRTGDRAFLAIGILLGTLLIGCSEDVEPAPVDVTMELTLSASASPRTGVAPLDVSFSAVAFGGETPLSYSWDFGDGGVSTESGPLHVYTDPPSGCDEATSNSCTYNATIQVTDGAGAVSTQNIAVFVYPEPEPEEDLEPSVTMAVDTDSGVAPLEISFTGTATGGNEPLSFVWEFGDGTMSMQQSPSHTYMLPGEYEAILTVTDLDGDSATDALVITIAPPEADLVPVAAISVGFSSGTEGVAYEFTAYASGGNGELTYSWDYGDGSDNETGETVTHAYNSPGYYVITLTVADEDGDIAVAYADLPIESDSLPTARLDLSIDSIVVPVTVAAHCNVFDGNDPISISWDWGTGDDPTTAGSNAEHTFTEAGEYEISCTATDRDDQSSSSSQTINLLAANLPTIISVNASRVTGAAPLEVAFAAEVVGGDGELTYLWTFGELVTSDAITPSYVFDEPGLYTVSLEVADQDDDSDSTTIDVEVLIPLDLEFTQFEVELYGRNATIDFEIANFGHTPTTGTFVTEIYYTAPGLGCRPEGSPEDIASQTIRVVLPSLATGSLFSDSVEFEMLPFGDIEFIGVIDVEESQNEWDESNNIAEADPVAVIGVAINEIWNGGTPARAEVTLPDGPPLSYKYIELIGYPGLDLTNWYLEIDAPGRVDTFGAGGPTVLTLADTIGETGYLLLLPYYFDSSFFWTFEATVTLYDSTDEVIDVVGIGEYWEDESPDFEGEGDAPTYVSSSFTQGRRYCGTDTDDNRADIFSYDRMTPERMNMWLFSRAGENCEDSLLLNPDGSQGVWGVYGDLTTAVRDVYPFPEDGVTDEVFSFIVPEGTVGTFGVQPLAVGSWYEDAEIEIAILDSCMDPDDVNPDEPVWYTTTNNSDYESLEEFGGYLEPGEYLVMVVGEAYEWRLRFDLFLSDPVTPSSLVLDDVWLDWGGGGEARLPSLMMVCGMVYDAIYGGEGSTPLAGPLEVGIYWENDDYNLASHGPHWPYYTDEPNMTLTFTRTGTVCQPLISEDSGSIYHIWGIPDWNLDIFNLPRYYNIAEYWDM